MLIINIYIHILHVYLLYVKNIFICFSQNILNKVLIAVLYIKSPNFPCPFPPQLVQ